MEKIKRITTYILMIFVGAMCFFACTKNPYKNMSLTVDLFVEVGTDRQEIKMGDDGYYTISLDSANTTPTILSVEAVVGGVDDKVSKAVVISSSDKNVASKRADGTLSANTTVEKYDIKAGGVTTFTINTAEGNKSVVARLRVVEPIRGLKFVAPSIAVVRGQLTNIAGLDNKYVSFVPATTSQKQLKSMQAYKADTSEIEPDVEIDGVNLRVASTSITSFKLRITSNYVVTKRIENDPNTEYKYDTEGHPYDEVVVNVLEPIGSIGLFENIPTTGEGTDKKPIKDVANKTGVEIGTDTYYSLKDDLTNKYGILLSSNIEKYKTATIGVLRENDKNKFGELPSAYSISIPNLVAGGKLDGINSVMIDVMSSSKIVLRATDLLSDYSLDIHVGYAGYESMIDGVTISLDLDIEVYPDDIKMYDLKGNELKVVTEGESESYAITVYSTYGLDYQYGTGIRISMLLQGQPLDSNQKMYLKIAKDDIVAKEQATENGVTYSKDVLEVRDGNGASLKVPNFERTENNAIGGTTTYYYFELKNNSIVYLKPGADMNTQMSPKSFSIISRNNSELKKQIAVSKYVSDIEFTTQTSPVYINVNKALAETEGVVAGYQVTSKEVGLDGISNWEEVISDVVITDNNNVLAQKPYEYAQPKDGADDARTIKLLVNGNKNLGEATIKLIAKNGKACTLRVIVFMPIGVDDGTVTEDGKVPENNISFNLLNYTITPTSDASKENLKSIQLKNDADGTVSDSDNKLTGTFGKIVAKEGEKPKDIWSYVQNGNNEYMAYNENGILASQKFVSVAKIDDIKDKTYSLALVQLLVGQTYKLSLTLNNKVYYTDTMPSGMRFEITPNKAYGSKVIGSEITTRYNGFEKIDIRVTGKNAEGSDVELKTAFYIQTQVPLSTAKFSESSTTVYSISSLSNKGEVGTKSNRELYGIYEFTFALASLGSNTLLDSNVISADVSFTFSQQGVNFLYDSKKTYDKDHDALISNNVANSQSLIELIKSSNISASKEYWFSNDSPNDKYCAVVLDMGDGTYRFLIDKYSGGTSFDSQSLSLTSLFKQTYIDEIGHKKTMPIYDTLNVTVIPAPYISSITAIVPDNMVTFDNRKMTTDNNGVFNSNNTSTFKYTYIVANVDKYGVKRPLNNEIVIDGSQYDVSVAVDIEKQEISVTANRITNPVNPVYTFVLNVCGTKGLGSNEKEYATKITLTVKITNGSENAPYEIANANDLHDIGRAMSSHYVLTRDINMSGFNWTPIVGEFTGSLNGHYTLPSGEVHKYVISNLTTTAYSLVNNNGKSYYGIFQIIGEKGVVQNLTINGVSIQLTYTQTDENALVCVGVIAGVNNGSIVNCSVVDGILWDKLSSDTVRMSSQIKNGINFTSESTKETQFNIGGFVGQNNGTVGDETNASICHMNILYKLAYGSAFVGGMIGENTGKVLNPDIYAKNNNLSIQNCLVKSIIRAFDQNANGMNKGNAYVGGVCGINSGNISRVRARVYIKDKTTSDDFSHAIGGAVGVNTSRIVECVVIPTLIGNSNIGGIVGVNIDNKNGEDTTFSAKNIFNGIIKCSGRLYNNKVQFVDLNDTLSSFNTSISGYSKLGGLVGYFVGRGNATGYAIESNSVYSYYTRDLSTFAYSEVDTSGQYYGDIVGKTNVGGLIGEAYGAFVYGTYVKANIYVYENTEKYIGGVIGSGDICNVTDGSVYVNVISKLTDANLLKAGAVFGYINNAPGNVTYAIEQADNCMEEGGTSSETNKNSHHVATTFACATQGDNYLPFAGSSSSVAGVNNCIIDGTTNTLENTTKSNTTPSPDYSTYVGALSLYINNNAEVGDGFTGEKAWIGNTQKYYYHNDINGGRPILFATRNGSRYTAYDKSEIDADKNEKIVSQSIRLIVDLPPTKIDVEHNDKIATHAISTITSRKLDIAPVKSTRVAKSNTTSTTSTDVSNKDNNTTNFDNQSIATYASQTTPEIKSTAITSGAVANTRNDYYRVEDNDRVGVVVSMYDVDLSGYYVDARGGIDFSGDKIVDSFEFVLSNRLYNKIIELNTYKYNDLVKIITLPPMLANFNVINIEIDGQSVMLSDDGKSLVALETGKSTITISSIFDSNVSAQFDVYVINAVRDFKLMDSVSSTDELSQINTTINVPKTISTYFDNQTSFDENVLSYYYNRKFNVAQNGNYGVRLYVSYGIKEEEEGEKIKYKYNLYFDTPNYWFNMTINNMPFSSQKISATGIDADGTTIPQERYLYYIDVNASDALNIKTFKDERDYHLIAVPYILVDGKVALLDSFHDSVRVETIEVNGKTTKVLEYIIDENNYKDTLSKYIVVNAKHGTHDISSSIAGDASSNKFTPESSLDFSIIVESDKEKSDKVEPDKVGNVLDYLLYLDITSKDGVSLLSKKTAIMLDDKNSGLAIGGESGTIELRGGAILLTYQRTQITDGVKGYKYDFNISVDLVKLKDLISTAKDLPLYDDYNFKYMVVKYDNTILSQKFAIRLDRQPVTGISASHYAGVSLQTTNVTEIKSTNYYKSDTLISTYSGLLAISITPDYGAVDYLRVTVSGMNQGTVSLSPILAMYSKNGGHEVFQDKYMLYSGSQLVGNSIRVNKISRIVDNDTQKYDGNIYLSTMCILNAGVDYSQFTLTIDAYTFDSTTPLKSVTKTIEVVSAPSVDMSINGRKYVAVAKGTYVDLKVTSNMDDVKIEYDNSMAYNKLTGKLYVGVTEGEYKIQATVTKTIHDRKFEYTDTLHVIVVPYVVTGINVDRVTNGRFIGNYNQPYILSVSLTANYAPIYEGAVATALNELADAISKDLTHTFYLVSGSRGEVYYENIIGGGQYADFHIEEKDGYFVLRNNVSNPTSRLGAQAVIDYGLTYDKNGKANGSRATKNPETMSQYAEYINCEFVLEFSRLSTLDNPEPIFTAQELLNMRAGGHYILLSDITLSPTDTVAPFTAPIDTAIGSLDGNDYIITISGFPVVQSDNIGLFSTIYADSIIKNLTIEIPFNEELTKEVESGKLTAGQDLYVDVTQNETTRFGILAGTNNGIVTNALVVNPAKANAIRTSRDTTLKDNGVMKDNSAMSVIIDNRTTSIVRVSSNITPSAQSRIAGLVGVNSGYITKSSVQNVSIFGDNFVSGFVCENSSIIGTSSAVGVNVSASASPTLNTALGASGFVLINNKNASIVECMVEGATNALNGGTIDTGALVGKHDVRNQNTFVNSTANATGFVFNNEGSVTDCYSNVVILGTLTSGFVFANGEDGKINNSIAFSSVYANQITAQPFTATKGSGTSYNNLGSITNCYYFIGTEESFTEPDSTSGAVALKAGSITKDVLDSFAFGNGAGDLASIWYIENNIPRLTSVDRVSLSLRVYCATDNENVAQKIYSGILAWDDSYRINTLTITTPMRSFSRNDISVTINGNSVEVIVRFDYSDKNQTNTIKEAIKDKIPGYNSNNITINIIPTTSALSSSSSFNYYYIGNEYGTENNPYLITSAEDYNSFVLRKVQKIKDGEIKNEPTREEGENVPDYMRIVSDFAFTKRDLVAETYNMDYSGVIDGNGMTISNLRVIADKDDVYAVTADVGDKKVPQYTALGMFRRLTGGVKSLNINVSEVKGSGVNLVGVIAGEINSGYVHNVNITSTQAISGLNAVGGVAGRVLGTSKISSVTVNVAVEATYYTTRNQFNISNYNTVKDNGTFYIYNGSVEDNVDDSNIKKVSYAGSVVGILDASDDVLNVNATTNNVAGNGTMVYGEIVGGLYGYVGLKSTVRNSQLLIGGMENEDDKYTSARLSGTRATGGIVGHNIGDVRKVSVSYIDRVQSVIDTAISSASKSANTTGVYDVDNGTLDLFAGNAHYIGGVVGLNDGTLMYAYNKINVANLSSLYAGGIIGASTTGGTNGKAIDNGLEYYPVREVYTTASVYAFHGQGGLIGALFTPQWTSTIDSDTIMPQHAFIANGLENGELNGGNRKDKSFNQGGSGTTECFPVMQSVASNMWKLDHINPTRASLTAIDAPVAHIGSLVGANYTKTVANNMYSRIINELNYTIQTYSYNTISLGILDNTARVISEIGNESKDEIGKIFNIPVGGVELIDYIDLKIKDTDPQQYYEKHQDLQYKSGSDLITFAYSGNMYNNGNVIGVEGAEDGEVYHFSRMRTYSSIRTLREIVNATYDNTDANAFTRRYASNANETINAIKVDGKVENNKSAKLPNIYSGWQSNIWRGVQMNGREKVDKTTFPTISPNVLGKADTTINWTITGIAVTVKIECATTGQLGTKPSINGDDHFSTTSAAEVTLSSDGSKVGSVEINTGDKYAFVGYKINGVSYSADKEYKLKFGSSPIIYAVFEYIPSSYKVSVNELYLDDAGKEHEITNKRDITITENANNNQGFTITEDINKVTVDNKKYPKSITIAGIQYSYSSATNDYCVAEYSVSGSTKKGDIYPVTDSNVSIKIVYKRIPKRVEIILSEITNDGYTNKSAGEWKDKDDKICSSFVMHEEDKLKIYFVAENPSEPDNTTIIIKHFEKGVDPDAGEPVNTYKYSIRANQTLSYKIYSKEAYTIDPNTLLIRDTNTDYENGTTYHLIKNFDVKQIIFFAKIKVLTIRNVTVYYNNANGTITKIGQIKTDGDEQLKMEFVASKTQQYRENKFEGAFIIYSPSTVDYSEYLIVPNGNIVGGKGLTIHKRSYGSVVYYGTNTVSPVEWTMDRYAKYDLPSQLNGQLILKSGSTIVQNSKIIEMNGSNTLYIYQRTNSGSNVIGSGETTVNFVGKDNDVAGCGTWKSDDDKVTVENPDAEFVTKSASVYIKWDEESNATDKKWIITITEYPGDGALEKSHQVYINCSEDCSGLKIANKIYRTPLEFGDGGLYSSKIDIIYMADVYHLKVDYDDIKEYITVKFNGSEIASNSGIIKLKTNDILKYNYSGANSNLFVNNGTSEECYNFVAEFKAGKVDERYNAINKWTLSCGIGVDFVDLSPDTYSTPPIKYDYILRPLLNATSDNKNAIMGEPVEIYFYNFQKNNYEKLGEISCNELDKNEDQYRICVDLYGEGRNAGTYIGSRFLYMDTSQTGMLILVHSNYYSGKEGEDSWWIDKNSTRRYYNQSDNSDIANKYDAFVYQFTKDSNPLDTSSNWTTFKSPYKTDNMEDNISFDEKVDGKWIMYDAVKKMKETQSHIYYPSYKTAVQISASELGDCNRMYIRPNFVENVNPPESKKQITVNFVYTGYAGQNGWKNDKGENMITRTFETDSVKLNQADSGDTATITITTKEGEKVVAKVSNTKKQGTRNYIEYSCNSNWERFKKEIPTWGTGELDNTTNVYIIANFDMISIEVLSYKKNDKTGQYEKLANSGGKIYRWDKNDQIKLNDKMYIWQIQQKYNGKPHDFVLFYKTQNNEEAYGWPADGRGHKIYDNQHIDYITIKNGDSSEETCKLSEIYTTTITGNVILKCYFSKQPSSQGKSITINFNTKNGEGKTWTNNSLTFNNTESVKISFKNKFTVTASVVSGTNTTPKTSTITGAARLLYENSAWSSGEKTIKVESGQTNKTVTITAEFEVNVTLTIMRDIFTTSDDPTYGASGNKFSYGSNGRNNTDNWWINAGDVKGRDASIKVAKGYDITITMKSKNYSNQLKKISGELTSQTDLAKKQSALQNSTANYATGYQITIKYKTWVNGSLKDSSLTIDCFELQHSAKNLTAIKHLNGYSIGKELETKTNQGKKRTVSLVSEAYGDVKTGTTTQAINGDTTLNLYIGFSDGYYGWKGSSSTFEKNEANYS